MKSMNASGTRLAVCGFVIVYLVQELVGLNLRWVDDETWHLIPAKTILTEGRVRIPVFNDSDREFWASPPLLPLLEAASWRIHEISIVQARLLTVAFGAATILATFVLARRLFDDQVALVAACGCAVENLVFLAGRTVRPEILVSFFTVSAMGLLLKAVQDGKLWPLVLAGLSFGAGISSHPNGAVASLCGVALLWLFEGLRFLRSPRIYLFTLCCTVAIVPMVTFWVVADAPSGFQAFHSLTELHSKGGPTLLERLGNSALTELTQRYVVFVTFPYRLHLALLSLAAVVVGLARRNRATRFLAVCVLLHLVFFAFVTKANKNPRYMTLIMPFVTILWAEWIVTLWTTHDWSGTFGRWFGPPARARQLACALSGVLVLSQLAGNAVYVWRARQADTEAACRRIDALLPEHSTVYGSMSFWIGLQRNHTFVPYMRMPWKQAIDEFQANAVILDDRVMVYGSYPGEWDDLRAELHEYVAAHGRLLGTVPDVFYGDLKIYAVSHP